MNTTKYRIIEAAVIIAIITCHMAACAQKQTDMENMVYQFTQNEFCVPEGRNVYDTDIYCVSDGRMYFTTCGDDVMYMNSIDTATGVMTEEFPIECTRYAPETEAGESEIVQIKTLGIDSDGRFNIVVARRQDTDMGEVISCNITKNTLSEDGKMVKQYIYDLSSIPSGSGMELCRIDGDGNTVMVNDDYVTGKQALYVFDTEGNKTSVIPLDNPVFNMITDNSGRVIINSQIVNDEGVGNQARYVDVAEGKLGPVIEALDNGEEIDSGVFRMFTLYDGNDDISFYINDSSVLTVYDEDECCEKQICRWFDISLSGSMVANVVSSGDGKLFCMYYDGEIVGDKYKLIGGSIEAVDKADDERTVITIADSTENYGVESKLIKIIRNNPDYKIEYKTYSGDDSGQKMYTDIIAGNIPDIFIMHQYYDDISNYINKGILEELDPYIASDDTVNEDYFLEGYLDAAKVDGKNYFLGDSFTLEAIVGNEAELGEYGDNWTVDEFIEYCNSKPEDTKPFADANKQHLAWLLISRNMDRYIDRKNGTCSFDDGAFAELLKFCNRYGNGDWVGTYEYDKNVLEIKKGMQLMEEGTIAEICDAQVYRKMFDKKEKYIGYPSGSEGGIKLNCFTLYGISSTSEHKNEAWDIIKKLLEEDRDNVFMPTSKEGFNRRYRIESQVNNYGECNGIAYSPATEEDVNVVKELLGKAHFSNGMYSQYEIILDDIEKYFSGERELDETVKIIQDRMSKYVSEGE